MAESRELGLHKPVISLKEQLARTTLRNLRSQGHTYVEIREDGKRFVFFCTLCLAPCYSDAVLLGHLNGSLHKERLSCAKITLLGEKPWPFNDGVLFFDSEIKEEEEKAQISGGEGVAFPLLDWCDDERFAIVVYDENRGQNGDDNQPADEIGRCADNLLISGLLIKERTVDLEAKFIGFGRVAARLFETKGRSTWIDKLWCEWLGEEGASDEEKASVPEHDFAIVTFSYFYNLGRLGFLDEPSRLLTSSPAESVKGEDNNGRKRKKSFSDPEDTSDSLCSQYDSSEEVSSRALIANYDDSVVDKRIIKNRKVRRELRKQQRINSERICEVCKQKMLPGKDAAAILNMKTGDCILCLKGFYEWKQAGGVGVWRYGGTVRIVSLHPKVSSASLSLGSESNTDESVSLDESESSQYDHLLDFLHLSNEFATEESETAISLAFLFDHFALQLLNAYLKESDGINDLPLNEMVIDTLLNRVVKDFSAILVSQGTQLGSFLRKILKCDNGYLSRTEFLEAVFRYLRHRKDLVSKEFSKFCTCGGKPEIIGSVVQEFSPSHAEAIGLQQKELEDVKSNYMETRCQVEQMQSEWHEELQRIVHHVKAIEVTSSSYHKVLEENRLLYNEVQDLKGTIRVYCRVRPFLQGTKDMQSTVDYIGENGNIMIVNPFKQEKDARKIFAFNKVFGQNVSQEQIYIDTQPVIRSVLDGFNVCIFAYGQTGSGKTYTMSGPDLMTETTWGVNYRALRDLFQLSNARTHVVAYEIGVQMIEIYNEQVRDLLVSDGSSRRLDIRNNSQLNGLNVPDASLVPVSSTRDVLDLMRIGQKNRAVGATALNERSSRSHSVLTVHVQGKELATGSILRGCLHLVDLAGSERVEKSEAVGERLKEAQHINKSLSALGDVISALAQKSSHVPYRNSKLTHVLQDSLGGQAKTLMFVHINPEVNAVGETISTLKFAQRVSSIELGAARSNKETGEIRDLKDEITSLKSALEKKEAELEQVRAGSIRATTECQKARTVSPFHIPRKKADASPQPSESMRNYETRSCSTGKQRKAGFTSAIRNREASQKMPNLAEERLDPRSPSPTSRRSSSTDRGSSIKSRNKPEVTQNLPVSRTPFPARVPVAKSFATVPLNPSGENRLRIDNKSETLHSHQKLSARKLFPEVDEQHMSHALNIRQGGVKKTKAESIKAKGKQPSPARFQKLDVGISLRSEADSQVKTGSYSGNNPNVMHSRFQNFDVGISLFSDLCAGDKSDSTTLKSDSSETDNEHVLVEPPLRLKNVQRNFTRNSQNHKLRTIYPHEDTALVNKLDDKPSKGNINISMPEFRRSRSTNHGRFP